MARVTGIKLKLPGINQILKSAQPLIDEKGQKIADAAGDGFGYQARPHRWTARGYVSTVNGRGRRREAKEKVLARSLSAGK